MADEESTLTSPQHDRETMAAERAAFNTIAEAMERLTPETRLRVLRALFTFFDLPITDRVTRSLDSLSSSVQQQHPASFSEDRSSSPKQFLLEKKPNTDVERVACLAYYLAHYRDTPHFKTLDLSKLNTDAAQIKLSNPAVAVDNAAKAGLLVQAGQGKKQLSALGELYVQALPDRAAAKIAIADSKPRRRSKGRAAGKSNKNVTS